MLDHLFSSNDIGSKLERAGDSGVTFNGKVIMIPDGKITSYAWNKSDGSLLLGDDKGNTWFMLGPQKGYIAYKGQSRPYDIDGYKRAVEKCREERELLEKKNLVKKKKNKEPTKKKKKTGWSVFKWLFKFIKWAFKGLFSLFLLLGFMGNNKD